MLELDCDECCVVRPRALCIGEFAEDRQNTTTVARRVWIEELLSSVDRVERVTEHIQRLGEVSAGCVRTGSFKERDRSVVVPLAEEELAKLQPSGYRLGS